MATESEPATLMAMTHAQRRAEFLGQCRDEFARIEEARQQAYAAADSKGVPRSDVDKKFGEETSRRFYGTSGESRNPIAIYAHIAKSLLIIALAAVSSFGDTNRLDSRQAHVIANFVVVDGRLRHISERHKLTGEIKPIGTNSVLLVQKETRSRGERRYFVKNVPQKMLNEGVFYAIKTDATTNVLGGTARIFDCGTRPAVN